MTRYDWTVKLLTKKAKHELTRENKMWLFKNISQKNIKVCLKSCIISDLEWTDVNKDWEVQYIQNGEEICKKELVDSTKSAFVILTYYENQMPHSLLYWYIPDINICEDEKVKENVNLKIKRLNLPTFEQWENNERKADITLGAYRVTIDAFCWGKGYTTYCFAASLSNRLPSNVYTNKLFYEEYTHYDDVEKLKKWYEEVVEVFHEYWEYYISETYFEPISN